MGRRTVFDVPAQRLADDLLDVGRADLHRRITEALCGSPLVETIVGDVQDELARVVVDQRVAERDRQEATRLINVGDNLLAAIGRTGTVSVAWRRTPREDDHPSHESSRPLREADGVYQGYWGGEETYESSPEFETLADALEWARLRAPHVRVVPWWDNGTYYWAGDGPPPVGMDALPDAEH